VNTSFVADFFLIVGDHKLSKDLYDQDLNY
jgi:hypothetical protein